MRIATVLSPCVPLWRSHLHKELKNRAIDTRTSTWFVVIYQHNMQHSTYHCIIVGAGSAGAILANQISKTKYLRVLLLEAGTKDTSPYTKIPVGYYKSINSKSDWQYQTNSNKDLNNRSLQYPRGKILGGSSSINGMIWVRGQLDGKLNPVSWP